MATNNNAQPPQPGPVTQQITKLQSNGHQSVTPQLKGQHPPVKKDEWGLSGKTFWDWLPLIIQLLGAFAIPISLFALYVSISQFNEQQKYDSQKTVQQNQVEFQNLKDQQQQTTLENYLDRMSDLLLTYKLGDPKPNAEAWQIAEARTMTALQNLNPARKVILVQFLYNSKLITYSPGTEAIISLGGTDLSNVDLHGSHFNSVDLFGVNLSKANFHNAYMQRADLVRANLVGADLGETKLSEAYLSFANLEGANLSLADLKDAYLDYANLKGATVTKEQLAQAKSLKGTTMPNGTIHP